MKLLSSEDKIRMRLLLIKAELLINENEEVLRKVVSRPYLINNVELVEIISTWIKVKDLVRTIERGLGKQKEEDFWNWLTDNLVSCNEAHSFSCRLMRISKIRQSSTESEAIENGRLALQEMEEEYFTGPIR